MIIDDNNNVKQRESARAILVGASTGEDISYSMKELEGLAQAAGIEVLGLLQEPTAAAISYNIKHGETILVFDLGGGTFDAALLRVDGGVQDRKEDVHADDGGQEPQMIVPRLPEKL